MVVRRVQEAKVPSVRLVHQQRHPELVASCCNACEEHMRGNTCRLKGGAQVHVRPSCEKTLALESAAPLRLRSFFVRCPYR